MRLLAGVMEPTSGEASVAGFSIRTESESIKERIGYMSQRFGLYEDLTVIENIHFYADLYGVAKRERPARIDRLLGFSNLTPFKTRLAGKLSGGMKQKLGLACALVHTPEVLFLDEPTNGVDPVSRRDFWKILYDLLREGITIFVSTAYLDEAERCRRVGLMHAGELLRIDAPAAIRGSLAFRMFEVWTSDTRGAVDAARESTGIRSAAAYGDRLHVLVDDPAAVDRLVQRLETAGINVHARRERVPSLEDVFVSMVEGR
jgi:ABC-2 type transport system ATP-binding protein